MDAWIFALYDTGLSVINPISCELTLLAQLLSIIFIISDSLKHILGTHILLLWVLKWKQTVIFNLNYSIFFVLNMKFDKYDAIFIGNNSFKSLYHFIETPVKLIYNINSELSSNYVDYHTAMEYFGLIKRISQHITKMTLKNLIAKN